MREYLLPTWELITQQVSLGVSIPLRRRCICDVGYLISNILSWWIPFPINVPSSFNQPIKCEATWTFTHTDIVSIYLFINQEVYGAMLSSCTTRTAVVVAAICLVACVQEGSSQCPAPNGYFGDAQQCDAYTECLDGVPERKLCPDGLMFNDQLSAYPRYPCSYPAEVQCGSRTRTQPPQSTGDCPHAYGLYKAARSGDQCGTFVNCVNGIASIHNCPEGLAFNPATIRCDWPDEVPECNAEQYLRFQCPGVRSEADLGHPRYSDPSDCRKFYVCVEGTKPRALSCGLGTVFNTELGVCDEPQNVPNCANYYPKEILDAYQKLRSYDNAV